MASAFPRFADWAAARNAEFGLGPTAASVRARVLSLAAQLNANPLPVPGSSALLTGNLLLEAEGALLEQDSYWPVLAGLWQAAANRSLPAGLASTLPWGAELTDNFVSAQDAVVCNDTPWPAQVSYYRAAVARSAARYPLTAGAPGDIWPCAFWPAPAADRAPAPSPHGPANILLVQNTADPSTAPEGAAETRAAFGPRAGMVTVDAVGHGVDTSQGCVGEAVAGFLLGHGAPPSGACPAAAGGA